MTRFEMFALVLVAAPILTMIVSFMNRWGWLALALAAALFGLHWWMDGAPAWLLALIASPPARQTPEEDQMTFNAITAAISFVGGLAVVELWIIAARLERIIVLLQRESFRKDREETAKERSA